MYRIAGFFLLLLAAIPAQAEPDALVQAVQMPAWLQRNGAMRPLAAGAELQNGDKLVTGSKARIYVQTADGSTVKLGENATLTLQDLSQQQEERTLFSALLEVAKGAFRFTTATTERFRARQVTVRVAGATVGIRGTDVWGKDGSELGVVCLIEGRIDVTGADNQAFVMDKPLSFYKMPKNAPPLPVAAVEPAQIKKWAQETDINQPASRMGGSWRVDLLVAPDEKSALAAYDLWRAAGYDVRFVPVAGAQGWEYILGIEQLQTRDDADAMAALLKGVMGAENPVVSR